LRDLVFFAGEIARRSPDRPIRQTVGRGHDSRSHSLRRRQLAVGASRRASRTNGVGPGLAAGELGMPDLVVGDHDCVHEVSVAKLPSALAGQVVFKRR
jgi:hypothetical protein